MNQLHSGENPWMLDPQEKSEICAGLRDCGLVKYDTKGKIPLKMAGGFTDFYINLREARNNPRALSSISEIYGTALFRLGVDRFVEIPDSVSCFAPLIATMFDIPYTTIRSEVKEGRVVAKIIGIPKAGEKVVIFDDVITDGMSKIEPYRECLRLGLTVAGIVVLVDREQGWRETFEREGMDVPVFAAMTLSEIRTLF